MRGIGLAALLLIAPSLCAGTWTVDDDGPADFNSIQQAIDALPAGETIVVHPGKYAAFSLDKRMQIFGLTGPAKPRVHGRSVVQAASSFTIVGLQLDALDVQAVPQRGRIEDCYLTSTPAISSFAGEGTLRVTGSPQVIVTRTDVKGFDDDLNDTPALRVEGSTVAVVACSFLGGSGTVPPKASCGEWGASGAELVGGSRVVATDSTFQGGDGAPATTFSQCGGNGGTGISTSGSTLELRTCTVIAGKPDLDTFLGTPAPPLAASGGLVVSEGVVGTFGSGAIHIVAPYKLPAISIEPILSPGSSGQLWLTGPIGEPGILVVSLAADTATLGHYEGTLWILPQPLLLIPFVTLQVVDFAVPAVPALSGTILTLQAVYPGLPGVIDPADVMTSNPDQLVIRY